MQFNFYSNVGSQIITLNPAINLLELHGPSLENGIEFAHFHAMENVWQIHRFYKIYTIKFGKSSSEVPTEKDIVSVKYPTCWCILTSLPTIHTTHTN